MTTPNQTIQLSDNTKPINSIVWQHKTKQSHCLTTPNQTITLPDNTKPNNHIVWQHVRTWYYDKRILPKIMCPHPLPHNPSGDPDGGAPCGRGEKKVVLERGWWKSYGPQGALLWVGSRGMKKLCHSRTTKLYKLQLLNQTIIWYDNTKPNNYMVWQHQTKQFNCLTTPNQTIQLSDNTKPNNHIVRQHQTKQLHCTTTPNQTIQLSDNTKPNNSIVWQHKTKQSHCLTTCKNMILWQEDTAKNNVSS